MTRFIEKETEADLRAELERTRNEVTQDRAALLQSTIKLSLEDKEKKTFLKKLQVEDQELDEELDFLTKQMDFAEEQNELLEKKVFEMQDGIFTLLRTSKTRPVFRSS